MKFLQENTLPKQIKTFFAEVNIPLNIISDELPTNVAGILGEEHPRGAELNALISDIYVLGIIDDSVFHNAPTHWTSAKIHAIQKAYDGLLVMGVKLKTEKPTRKQLSDISRIFNRTFPYMPLLIVFEYGKMLAFANHERVPYHKIAKWREGEKIGKVSLLKDIDKQNPHSGHLRILNALKIAANVRTFADLYLHWQNVLSISTLNKEFYQKLFNWYLWAVQEVKFPQIRPEKDKVADEVHQSESLIRLLTRLLFVWFMKEKGLISKDLFDKDILSHILIKDFGAENGVKTIYYKAILQNLFFATLNRPIHERNQVKKTPFLNAAQYGDTLLYRFGDLFQDSEHFVEHFANVPFLNGGLFDCLDQKKDDKQTEEIRLDGFSSVAKKQVIMPDKLFFGEHKVATFVGTQAEVKFDSKQGSEKPQKQKNVLFEEDSKYKTTVYGLIDILHQYKFTIEENTPLEEEIALDPELLGKVFENLLASYNPETQSTARKQTGSFYTPREIVDYMVEESLVAYLLPKIADYQLIKLEKKENEASAEEKLRTLLAFSNESNPFDGAETIHLLNAINECKILDPACGSGAFPMGVLQKMIFILQKLDPQNKIWLELMLQNVPSTLRAKMKEKLENENLDYARKLGIIQECIYGIDIQPIATQIAKLRFFISLLVDQKGDPQKENLGFDPLPNLDFKIVTANSLVSAPKNELIESAGYVSNSLKQFEQLTHDYFNAHIPSEKQKLKQEIIECIQKIVAANKEVIRQWVAKITKENNSASPTQKKKNAAMLATFERDLAQWESYENLFKHEAVGFFETKYFFPQVKNGFDLVIGNPPYVNTKRGIAKELKSSYENYYSLAKGQYDLFTLFIENAIQISKTVCFIVPKPLINNENYKDARKMLLNNGLSKIVVGSNVFENAAVESCIFLSNRESPNDNLDIFEYFNNQFSYKSSANRGYYLQSPSCIISTEKSLMDISILQKIETNSFSLGEILKITRGIEGGKSDESISTQITDYKLIRGEDLDKYNLNFQNIYVDFDIDNQTKFKHESLYFQNKILIRRVGNDLKATYDNDNYVVLNTIYCAYLKVNNFTLTYCLAILNSKLINYWFQKTYSNTDKLFPYIRTNQIEAIPISQISLSEQQPFMRLVEYILWLKTQTFEGVRDRFMATYFEEVIDGMVYELYFAESFQKQNKSILANLGELPEISAEMPDNEKLSIIRSVFYRLDDKKHLVRNHLFYIDSIPEVAIIMAKQ